MSRRVWGVHKNAGIAILSRVSTRSRIGLAAVAIVVLIVGGLGLWRLLREPAPVRLMRSLPSGQAAYLYFDAQRLKDSRLVGPRFDELFADRVAPGLLADRVEAGAAAIGADTVYLVLAADAPESLLRGSLEDLGADCARPLDEAACAAPGQALSGMLSVRLLSGGVIGVANGPTASAADGLAAISGGGAARLAEPARAAVSDGALLWMDVDPARLAAVMDDPPEGWINLSLIARALITADQARFTLSEEADGGLELLLRAETDEGAELVRVLEGLNKFGAAALGKGRSESSRRWGAALGSFRAEETDGGVEARWVVGAEAVEGLF